MTDTEHCDKLVMKIKDALEAANFPIEDRFAPCALIDLAATIVACTPSNGDVDSRIDQLRDLLPIFHRRAVRCVQRAGIKP